MKQESLFEDEFVNEEEVYTSHIVTPVYKPRNKTPHILELIDTSKSMRLINEINNSNLNELEKKFLIESAKRHNVFNYEKIADYYATANPEMQKYMERSVLVIVDFNKAYENGYINLANELANQYFDNYGK